jgi:hypothetical protein
VIIGNLTEDTGGESTLDRDDDASEFSVEGPTAEENGDFVAASPEGTLTLHPDGSYEFAIDPPQNGLEDGESAVTDNGQPILSNNNTLTVTISAW